MISLGSNSKYFLSKIIFFQNGPFWKGLLGIVIKLRKATQLFVKFSQFQPTLLIH